MHWAFSHVHAYYLRTLRCAGSGNHGFEANLYFHPAFGTDIVELLLPKMRSRLCRFKVFPVLAEPSAL